LGKHIGPDFEIIDSVVAKNEYVEFTKNEKLETGVYFIVIPPQTRFDFLIADDQDILITTDTRNILGKLSINGEKQYQVFVDIQKEIAKINKQRSQLEIQLEFFKMYQKDTVKDVQNIIDSLNNEQMQVYSRFKTKLGPNTFLYKIIEILEPFEAPNSIKELQYSSPAIHYNYYVKHYLDKVDFNDEDLMNTPEFIFHKTLTDYCYYFFDIRANKLNEVYLDIDSLIAKTESSPKYRKYILSYLISRYENPTDLRLEAILVYIYRNYFLVEKPEWVSEQAYQVMKFKIESIQYNLIGSTGKNLNLIDVDENPVSIYNIKANYKVLIFWEPECEICKDALIRLQKEYDTLETINTQVIAVLTNNEDLAKWKEYTKNSSFNWINAYDKKDSSNFEIFYGTYKTPRLFILDSNNHILTKDIKPEWDIKYQKPVKVSGRSIGYVEDTGGNIWKEFNTKSVSYDPFKRYSYKR
jgi:alkyl hydroperoxide reductase subunit AhpC